MRPRALPFFTVITVFVAVAIPVQLSARSFTTFEVPGSVTTQPYSINRTGAITGLYAYADGLSHGFVRDNNGNITTFDVPGAIDTSAISINSTGRSRDSTLTRAACITASSAIATETSPRLMPRAR